MADELTSENPAELNLAQHVAAAIPALAPVSPVSAEVRPGGHPRPAHLWRTPGPRLRFQTNAVIVKLRSDTPPVRAVARALRTGISAEVPKSVISRLLENGYAVSADPVFDSAVSLDRIHQHARFLAAAVEMPEQPANSRGLVELAVDPRVDAHRLARDLSEMGGELEYAIVPAIRHPFVRQRRRAGPDPLASRQWSHGAVRIAYARKLTRFDDAADVTVAIVDSGIDASP